MSSLNYGGTIGCARFENPLIKISYGFEKRTLASFQLGEIRVYLFRSLTFKYFLLGKMVYVVLFRSAYIDYTHIDYKHIDYRN